MKKVKGQRRIEAIGIALIVLPLFFPLLFVLLFAGHVVYDDANSISALPAISFRFRPESHNPTLVRRQIGAFNQVDAIRNRGHDRVQAIADGAGLAGQIDD